MEIVTKTITSENYDSEKNKKHLVYFFGLGDCIRDDESEQQRWEDWEGQNIDIYMFNYHYSENDYPEHFCNIKFKLKRALITTIVASALGLIGYSIIASQMPIALKVPVFIAFLVPAIIAAIVMSHYSTVTPIVSFCTKGKDPIKAGVAMVTDLLKKGVHPDDIILMGNSLGGGIAAEVLHKLEEANIHFTLIHNNSYSSVQAEIQYLFGSFIAMLAKWFDFNYKPNEIIKSTKTPVLVVNKIGDEMISEKVQSLYGLKSQVNNKDSTDNLKVLVTLRYKDYKNSHDCDIHNIDEFEMDISNIDCLGSNRLLSNEQESYSYKELLWGFISTAYKYLEEKELNKNFKLKDFKQSKSYQKINKDKISLIDIDNSSVRISPIISRKKMI
ncbi:hypothetical protein [Candidatus Mesenet endosymbiont of Agriotes lineatus]|uniref:hypothetical protein n=1 Tax=Candidatus Mesenet endosymbiont of Agriotes lineatus TaxID=3077948 RepID=UPI0030D32B4D